MRFSAFLIGLLGAALAVTACAGKQNASSQTGEALVAPDTSSIVDLSEKDQTFIDDLFLFSPEKHKEGTCATFNYKGVVDDDVMATFVPGYILSDRFHETNAKQYVTLLLQRDCQGETLRTFSGADDEVIIQFLARTDSALFCSNYGFLDTQSIQNLARTAIFQTGYVPTDSATFDVASRLDQEIAQKCNR